MQPHKSVATSRVNPGSLRKGGGTEMWVAVCRKWYLFRIWRHSRNEENRKKYCEAKILRELFQWQ